MTDESDNVVFLAFTNGNLSADNHSRTACASCLNKTFVIVHDLPDQFPSLRCAVCQMHIGRIGWAPEIDKTPNEAG